MELSHNPKSLLHLLHTIYLGEALLHIAFNKRAVTMHRSIMSTHAYREAVRGLSLQGSNSHRKQKEKGRLIRRNFIMYFY